MGLTILYIYIGINDMDKLLYVEYISMSLLGRERNVARNVMPDRSESLGDVMAGINNTISIAV